MEGLGRLPLAISKTYRKLPKIYRSCRMETFLCHVGIKNMIPSLLLSALLSCAFSACHRNSAELQALREENERLKKALLEARGETVTAEAGAKSTAPAEEADLDLSISELWTQRFGDTHFRAKQRLDQKQVRVTGMVESVTDRTVTLFGTGTRVGSVSLLVQLDEPYLKDIGEGLLELEKGALVTVQGRFVFDKMWLQDAGFVDRKTGKRLLSKELMAAMNQPANADEPHPSNKTPEKTP